MVEKSKRIPIPLSRRWRRFRHQALPLLMFAGSLALVGYLWQRQGAMPNAVGQVEIVRVEMTSRMDGLISNLERPQWSLFERVETGEVLARFDDRSVRARLATLQAELARIRLEVAAAAAQLSLDNYDRQFDESDRQREVAKETIRLTWEIERLRLDQLDRRTQVEVDRIELNRRKDRLEYLGPLVKKNAVPRQEFLEQQMLHDRLAENIKQSLIAISESKAQGRRATQRLQSLMMSRDNQEKGASAQRDIMIAQQETILKPLRAAIGVQEARIKELQVEVKALEILAPISGTIAQISAWPGQSVAAGEPIVTIAAEHGRYIVSYLRPYQQITPKIEEVVQLRFQNGRHPRVASRVTHIGPQIEPIPTEQLRDPRTPEWGLPIRIYLPEQLAQIPPGTLLNVTFQRK